MHASASSQVPEPIEVNTSASSLDELLSMEWLRGNRLGAYSCSSVTGCNTRRYHGLLVASLHPPVERVVALSSVMEYLHADGQVWELATNEFDGAFAPRGHQYLQRFVDDVAPRFVWQCGQRTLTKEVLLHPSANAVAVRYTLEGGPATLAMAPFVAMRDFHHVRDFDGDGRFTCEPTDGGAIVREASGQLSEMHIRAPGVLCPAANWWHHFFYRVDVSRGQDGLEDLYSPGQFRVEMQPGQSVLLTAGVGELPEFDFDAVLADRRARRDQLAASVGPDADDATRRLAMATDVYVVRRDLPDRPDSTTVLAGFPWFADWGRDALIALPGLLLSTGRFDEARQVLETFAGAIDGGMVPNRFDDYGGDPHYNSMDASMWFIVTADRYLRATGDDAFWADVLMGASRQITRHFRDGTRFGIHADADGLITGGSAETQLTWMDAKLGDEPITPRHGKPVEINAMWYAAHRILAQRAAGLDDDLASTTAGQAEQIGESFRRVYWNPQTGCLNDCITDGQPDGSVRPNQLLAVSLPYSPLKSDQQRSVVDVTGEALRTPLGLRSLHPCDPRYRRGYGSSWESRDRAYHQGTVWGWLIGPFIEAYLNVYGRQADYVNQAAGWLAAVDGHLRQAGLGQVSEIFDGDPPHAPRGCFAQAWSVAEWLRAKLLVAERKRELA